MMRSYLLNSRSLATIPLSPFRHFVDGPTGEAPQPQGVDRSRALMEWKLISAGEVEARDDDEPIERDDLPRGQ
jgi:hypothetical protein